MRARSRYAALLVAPLAALAGCGDGEVYSDVPECSVRSYAEVVGSPAISKVDLLVVLDDTGDVAARQATRSLLQGFLGELLSPPCENAQGLVSSRPDPALPCPEGEWPARRGLLDVQVGVLGTALAGRRHPDCERAWQTTRGRLIQPAGAGGQVGEGFLRWDPLGFGDPPGGDELGAFLESFGQMLDQVDGECPFPAPLDAWYRLLVDPEPYEDISWEPCSNNPSGWCAEPVGTDALLLDQRERFHRKGSALFILLVNPRNDCSFRTDALWLTDSSASVTREDEDAPPELRCWAPFDRFGIDALEPIRKYTSATEELTICQDEPYPSSADACRELVKNPLWDGQNAVPWNVTFLGVLGAPSDLLTGELTGGLDQQALFGDLEGRWPPTDARMLESNLPREGLPPPTASAPPHERDTKGDALQYACTSTLPEPVRCMDGDASCACSDVDTKTEAGDYLTLDPLCQDPTTGRYSSLQRGLAALPTPRQFRPLSSRRDDWVASYCANLVEPESPRFGYRPLQQFSGESSSVVEGRFDRCVPHDGPCRIFEVRRIQADAGEEACDCSERGRQPTSLSVQAWVREQLASRLGLAEVPELCSCELGELSGTELETCRTGQTPSEAGFCYLDTEQSSATRLGCQGKIVRIFSGSRAESRWFVLGCQQADCPAKNPSP